jgi:hypothetical protein
MPAPAPRQASPGQLKIRKPHQASDRTQASTGISSVEFDSPMLGRRAHDVFFADRDHVGVFLSLNLLSTEVVITPGVPEPGSWTIFLAGLGLVALFRRLAKRPVRH